MKKIIMLLLIIFTPVIILAKEYESSEINLKISVKDNLIVLTRDNLINNPDLAKLNITKEYMDNIMNANNIYLDIIKKDLSYEVLVVSPNTKLQFNNLMNATDEMLNDLKNELVKKTGSQISNVYKGKHNYIVVDYYDSKTNLYILTYYTVVNARSYNFQLQKKNEITDTDKKELLELVDSTEIKILDEYRNESNQTQKQIDNYGKKQNSFNYWNIVYGAIIGGLAGLISYLIGSIIKKKKSSE